MAKGQIRSKREARKPKMDRNATPMTAAQVAQVKLASNGFGLGKKQK